MAINFKYDDEENLTARERLQLAEERKRNFQQQMADSAHERFMAQHRNYMERNPNAYSVAEREKVFGDARQGQLMQHEMNMLGQKGENEQELQRVKNRGLVNVAEQDRLAREKQAQLQLEGSKYAEDKKLEGIKDTNQTSILHEKERQMGQLNVENARQKGQLDVEKERQAGALDVQVQQGKDAKEIEAQRGKTAEAVANIEQRTKEGQARIEAMRQNGKDAVARERLISQQIAAFQKDPANRNLTPEELRAKALKMLGYAGQGGSDLSQFAE